MKTQYWLDVNQHCDVDDVDVLHSKQDGKDDVDAMPTMSTM